MTSLPDVVGLLYRADWTRLSMSAEVNIGIDPSLRLRSAEAARPPWPPWEAPPEPEGLGGFRSWHVTLLIAPGQRYREQNGEAGYARGCDRERCWELRAPAPPIPHMLMRTPGEPDAPFPDLLCPASLLTGFNLEVRGPATACGRDAVHVVATPRTSIRDKTPWRHLGVDRVDAIVDAELGILLRREDLFQGQMLSLTELVSVTIDPPEAADDAQFRPPPGSVIVESLGETLRDMFDHPGWRAAKTAAGLAAGGLGAWVRYSPFPPWHTAAADSDAEPDMPPDEPGPRDGPPVSDEIVYLLYRSGSEPAELVATLHHWQDVAAMTSRVPAAARDAGHGGLGCLLDAASEQVPSTHTVADVRIGGQGTYRIDYTLHPGRHPPTTIACDGQRRWQVYQDRVRIGPPASAPYEVGDLVDASWLLECQLSGGAEVTVGDRRGYRISIANGPSPTAWLVFFPAQAVVDAELGILLRLICYADGRPATRYELRGVATEPGEPDDFRIEVPRGLRTFEETGNPFADAVADMPGPAGLAARAAVDVAKRTSGAVSAARSFLDNLRGHLPGPLD